MSEFFSAVATLFFVMDPLGNVPAFLSCLKDCGGTRRQRVVARENIFALLILLFFLFCGPTLMGLLHIGRESLHIAGGVLLFLIALGMIFPGQWHMGANPEHCAEQRAVHRAAGDSAPGGPLDDRHAHDFRLAAAGSVLADGLPP